MASCYPEHVPAWFLLLCTPLLLAVSAQWDGLPLQALVLEEAPIPASAHSDRALILWIVRPSDVPPTGYPASGTREEAEEAYTCPDQSRGQFYRAPTRVSLVDTRAKRVINTVPVKYATDEDTFDIPYRLRPGYSYRVPGPLSYGAGKPKVFDFHDWNSDGRS